MIADYETRSSMDLKITFNIPAACHEQEGKEINYESTLGARQLRPHGNKKRSEQGNENMLGNITEGTTSKQRRNSAGGE